MSKGQTGTRIKPAMMVLFILFLPLFTWLGVWQLDRAEEKRDLLEAWSETMVTISELHGQQLNQFSPVRLQGTFNTERLFLLDNRVRKGKVGYEVLGLFHPYDSSQGILVNLGWVLADSDRSRLPSIELPVRSVTLTGRLLKITRTFTLAEDLWRLGWPKRIQQIDLPRIERLVGVPIHDWQVRLNEPLLVALEIDWEVVSMPPEKHIAYAVQWFSLAVALVIWLGWYSWQSKHGSKW